MAESQSNKSERSKDGGQSIAQRNPEQGSMQREQGAMQRGPSAGGWASSPFELMDRMSDEMDRLFDRVFGDFGMPRRSSAMRAPFRSVQRENVWAPRVEAFQQGDRFIVRADLPGLKKDDVQVELTDDAITIHGERRNASEEERECYYHSEREYGQFYRMIPLPEGVIGESAKASFNNGVLEISMQAPPAEASRGRKIEIKEGQPS